MTGPLSILIIGTENPELQALGHSFRNYGVSYRYLAAKDEAAVNSYFQKGLSDAMFVPTLIMLDMDAGEPADILTLLKHHPVLRRIPVIIYGHDNDPERVKLAYRWGATCYMPKPDNWEDSMGHFCSYWKKRVALPIVKAEDILSTNFNSHSSNRNGQQ